MSPRLLARITISSRRLLLASAALALLAGAAAQQPATAQMQRGMGPDRPAAAGDSGVRPAHMPGQGYGYHSGYGRGYGHGYGDGRGYRDDDDYGRRHYRGRSGDCPYADDGRGPGMMGSRHDGPQDGPPGMMGPGMMGPGMMGPGMRGPGMMGQGHGPRHDGPRHDGSGRHDDGPGLRAGLWR